MRNRNKVTQLVRLSLLLASPVIYGALESAISGSATHCQHCCAIPTHLDHNSRTPSPHHTISLHTHHLSHIYTTQQDGRHPDVPRRCRHPHHVLDRLRRADGRAICCARAGILFEPDDAERWLGVRQHSPRRPVSQRQGNQTGFPSSHTTMACATKPQQFLYRIVHTQRTRNIFGRCFHFGRKCKEIFILIPKFKL